MRITKGWIPFPGGKPLAKGTKVQMFGYPGVVSEHTVEPYGRYTLKLESGVKFLHGILDNKLEIIGEVPIYENDFDLMLTLYSAHDWSYDYSDDVDARRKGRMERQIIECEEKKCDPEHCLAALLWAYRLRSVPPEEYELRRDRFLKQSYRSEE